MKKEVEFTIDEDGHIEMDMTGFEGKSCTEISQKLAKALGTVIEHYKKAEYYKTVSKQKQKVRRGM